MPKTQIAASLLTSRGSAAGATERAALDCTNCDGGILTFRITNGASGPTAQCVARVLIAHKGETMPAVAAEGTGPLDWKQVYELGGGTASNAVTRGSFTFGPEIAYLMIEFSGHTSFGVTVEAFATLYAY